MRRANSAPPSIVVWLSWIGSQNKEEDRVTGRVEEFLIANVLAQAKYYLGLEN